MQRLILTLAAIAAATPALAGDTALVRPSRDAVVTYRSTAPGQNGASSITMHFANQGYRIRIDGATGNGYVVFDSSTNRMLAVTPDKGVYVDHPSDGSQLPVFFSLNIALTKTGTATIAGFQCTTYDASVKERKARICLSADGVLLRAQSTEQGRPEVLEALSVVYAPQVSAMFEPPAGFRNADTPQVPAGAHRPMAEEGPPMVPRGSYLGAQTGR